MLTFLGYSMVATFMALIMTKRMTAMVALMVVPIVFGLIAGAGTDIGKMMMGGLVKLAPTAAMLFFGIIYFCIMTDAGLFDPLIRVVVKTAKGDPLRIIVGTAVMGTVVALDGDGATTYVICTAALLPVYRRLGIRLQYMATLVLMSIGIMNILPWGGPTARAASAMHLDVSEVFVPLILPMLTGFAYVLCVAFYFGVKERKRIGRISQRDIAAIEESLEQVPEFRRPQMLPLNLILTVVLIVALIQGLLPLPILFMVATAIALILNYPSVSEQKERLSEHAYNVLAVVSLIFAAGIFTGILNGTGMLDAMSKSLLYITPDAFGPYLAPFTAVLSGPATYAVTNDAFYFGVLPILAKTAAAYGITAAEMARASLVGQPLHLLSPLVASTYLLVALLDINYGENQRASILWVIGLMFAMLAGALIFGAIPLRGSIG
ncbi:MULTISPECIES: CitMHS family transporter [Agrobacterium]|uniref:CitMHS family citrate-Mg2+:H+ or citrate-Ca2+:H+ symporter n=1 Tax=Agrobacterium tumefaciens TaxID=358 RepID=A0AAW8M2G1_AGRTU|nr:MULTISPECIES: citrate:proton symporter [Agrobacterium]MBP2511708.1 CitMHS family citrate-Mg2+:H+ or citrate-Ca2+:H+ symporter [Agrobacterium tumefaciens]MBP2520870.1 CitMHS family citrate-Mg2+:H+ or citrate-Ca2+:H+ symporter [Agrobacterium tumefaciens]MBP2537563.1 CitMHS family citrate-Mg2+:H+ or citrate-Ca2+:H+ symporter [Agrobacterium tumefaciens]MBP2542764.1 CitMHS family citrate-Mg2+:H+ or citrate-Ca2+:H+ symporter [Agrobacterium tumefaciens]MBP2568811.1 CitMHS family citrate-Mg2+:H+ or